MYDNKYIFDMIYDNKYIFDIMYDKKYIFNIMYDKKYIFNIMYDITKKSASSNASASFRALDEIISSSL